MRVMKAISRYFFMGLLLAGCIFWIIYCGNASAQLQAKIEGAEFIDLAAHSTTEAIALVDRQAYFEDLMYYGIVAAVVVVFLTCGIAFAPTAARKWNNRPKKEKPAPVVPAPEMAIQSEQLIVPQEKPADSHIIQQETGPDPIPQAMPQPFLQPAPSVVFQEPPQEVAPQPVFAPNPQEQPQSFLQPAPSVIFQEPPQEAAPQPVFAPFPQEQPPVAARPSRRIFCPRCGTPLDVDAKFCTHCGQALP